MVSQRALTRRKVLLARQRTYRTMVNPTNTSHADHSPPEPKSRAFEKIIAGMIFFVVGCFLWGAYATYADDKPRTNGQRLRLVPAPPRNEARVVEEPARFRVVYYPPKSSGLMFRVHLDEGAMALLPARQAAHSRLLPGTDRGASPAGHDAGRWGWCAPDVSRSRPQAGPGRIRTTAAYHPGDRPVRRVRGRRPAGIPSQPEDSSPSAPAGWVLPA